MRAGAKKLEWSNEDFASCFLHWLVTEFPATRGGRISLHDIEKDFFPRFKAAAGCRNLRLGALLRGLGNVTTKTEVPYIDATGRRRTLIEYEARED